MHAVPAKLYRIQATIGQLSLPIPDKNQHMFVNNYVSLD